MHYLLLYEISDDYLERRAQFREEHLKKAWQASANGELVLGGALGNPVEGAALLFKGESPEAAEKFARTDPYVLNGLVKRWHVRQWNTVAGQSAENPVRVESSPATERSGEVLRVWKARSTPEKVGLYERHATEKVFPALRAIPGFREARLIKRASGGRVEVEVHTRWESMDAVRKFAGDDPSQAVVEPDAHAGLTDFDRTVTHFEIVRNDAR